MLHGLLRTTLSYNFFLPLYHFSELIQLSSESQHACSSLV